MNNTILWLLFSSTAFFAVVGAQNQIGDPCSSNDDCLTMRCYERACSRYFLNGESCSGNTECASVSCNNGVCTDPAENGQACETNANCVFTCVNSVCTDGRGDCYDNNDCFDVIESCLGEVCTERSEVAGPCDDDGDCLRKLQCSNSACRLNEKGEQCELDSDCENNLPCQKEEWFLPKYCGDCFSGLSTVEVEGKGLILMKDLKINDWVRCEDGAFSQVFSFSHYHPRKKLEYLQIHVENEKLPQKNGVHRLEISKDHLLYVVDMNTRKRNLVAAESVTTDDWLVSEDGSFTKVTGIAKINRRGLYAPSTTTGNILVGGVLASNHVTNLPIKDFVSGQTIHLLQQGAIFPYRIYCYLANCEDETYDKVTGYSSYIVFCRRVVEQLLDPHAKLRPLYLVLLAGLCAIVICVGAITSASASIIIVNVLAFSTGYYVWTKTHRHTFRSAKISPPVKK